MKGIYNAQPLPQAYGDIDYSYFLEELIDATAAMEVYKEKINDSKVNSNWFMPTLQQKEAIKSSMLEGTQATLDGVLINQIAPDENNRNFNEVSNYFRATVEGYKMLKRGDFNDDFFCSIHRILLSGKVRKHTDVIGAYRKSQNYIGKTTNGALVYTPPKPEDVPVLMKNLIDYMNNPSDALRPLVRTAIIHAQFETIHPFGDGNGRVGRILIPLYLYTQNQLTLPYFFISEALEKDKHKYYKFLMDTRETGKWNEWIKFFLETVAKQCRKYIKIISDINILYDMHLEKICNLIKSSSGINKMVDVLFQYPIFDAKIMQKCTDIPLATVNRYLKMLVDNNIIYTDDKKRNRNYFYYDLLALLRE